MPPSISKLGVEISYRLDDILPRCDVINMLRIQFERQRSGLFPSIHEYARLFGMDQQRMRCGSQTSCFGGGADQSRSRNNARRRRWPHSAILQQVTNGLAVRMAILSLASGKPGPAGAAASPR